MWRCKHVADALAENRYWELPRHKRWLLKFHIVMCAFCGRFHHQVIDMQICAHKFREAENDIPCDEDHRLSSEAGERIANNLKEQA